MAVERYWPSWASCSTTSTFTLDRGKTKNEFSTENVQIKYVRCTKDAFKARLNRHSGIFTFLDVDGSETNVLPLRPFWKEVGHNY